MRFTVSRKLTLAFGLVLGITALGSAITLSTLRSMGSSQSRVMDQSFPAALAASAVRSDINESLAILRGYIILGSDPAKASALKQARAEAWTKLDESLTQLETLTAQAPNADKERIGRLRTEVADLRKAQDEIEAIAQTPDNVPALKMLVEEAAPKGAAMFGVITEMMNEEMTLGPGAERKALLGAMADARASLAAGLASVRAYLLTGDEKWREDFDAKWKMNGEGVERVEAAAALMSPKQAEKWAAYKKTRAEFAPVPAEMFTLRAAPDWNRANAWLGTRAAPKAQAAMALIGEATDSFTKTVDETRAAAAAAFSKVTITLLSSTGIAALLAVVIGIIVTRRISHPLKHIGDRLELISKGDLTQRATIASHDELGDLATWFNSFAASLQEVMKDVSDATRQVAAASTEVAASSTEIASGLKSQESHTIQVSAAIEEMSSSVREVAEKGAAAAQTAAESGQKAEQGGTLVSETAEKIKGIADEVTQAATVITDLGRKGEQIGQIIGVINDIADQTNLLALNAAIEAARAGEHGRGFAVVADEVRKLAERTTKATEEVTRSIRDIQSGTEGAVARMESSSQSVESGVALAATSGEAIGGVVAGARQIHDLIQQIAAAAEQQSVAGDEVAKAIAGIKCVTEESARGAEQSAEAAGNLSQQAEHLQKIISRFTV